MKLFVTGSGGFIGGRFCAAAQEAGHQVRAMLRPRHDVHEFPSSDIVYGELPYDVPEDAIAGTQVFVHCAAATTGQTPAESEAINVDGLRVLLRACRETEGTLKRFVFLSSQSAHEGADSAYGKTKLRGEKLVKESGLPYAILRPGLVFGPGKQGLFYRMRQSVSKLPLLPLIGGGKAWVQAIEVGDLCEAMLRCVDLPDGENAELNLGDPVGMSLRDFLQAMSMAERGKPKPQLIIPTGPIKIAVGAMEALRLPSPISSDNIRGMELVRKMETADSLQRLGLTLKPTDKAMHEAIAPAPVTPKFPSVRVLLIGAGKIGIVHSLNLTRREGSTLCGIVDRNPKAFGLYKSMGFRVPFFTDLNAAIAEAKPHAVIIATPAATHLPIARDCLHRGLPVLVEKPMSVTPAAIAEFQKLCEHYPDVPVHFGYMAAQFPHLSHLISPPVPLEKAYGKVLGFHAFALQSHIMGAKPVRWEMLKAQAGGGVLINFGCHVLSILFRILGMPEKFEANTWPIYSTEVEDAAYLKLDYGEFSGTMVASWSIPDYPRPLNRLAIHYERATVVIENYSWYIEKEGYSGVARTQRDYDIGYNAAPDYTGGGFSVEHSNFAAAVRAFKNDISFARTTYRPEEFEGLYAKPVEIDEAARLEKFIHSVYERATPGAPSATAFTESKHGRFAAAALEKIRR